MNAEGRLSVLEHLNTVIELRFAAAEREMTLYRLEIEKRLGVLNDHDRKMQGVRDENEKAINKMLPKDIFDLWVKDRDIWRQGVDQHLAKIEQRSITWSAAILTFVTLLTLALHFWSVR